MPMPDPTALAGANRDLPTLLSPTTRSMGH
jgi:hypothetical protein